jgi:hypothetical protein
MNKLYLIEISPKEADEIMSDMSSMYSFIEFEFVQFIETVIRKWLKKVAVTEKGSSLLPEEIDSLFDQLSIRELTTEFTDSFLGDRLCEGTNILKSYLLSLLESIFSVIHVSPEVSTAHQH